MCRESDVKPLQGLWFLTGMVCDIESGELDKTLEEELVDCKLF